MNSDDALQKLSTRLDELPVVKIVSMNLRVVPVKISTASIDAIQIIAVVEEV